MSQLSPALETWADQPLSATLRVIVSVDNNHCHRYAICQQEAPEVFDLTIDGRLSYDPSPDPARRDAVQQAARLCPMQAITLTFTDGDPS